ncbi:hypothetical protein HAX54_046709 [Datura stramonium]|uniref:Uncharacterized protein n=1 Tax=Datura stramonium TaxID=4076 RepID=A0ABS8WL86_DATST|nr:hypothetical protein [Datura stramonium]
MDHLIKDCLFLKEEQRINSKKQQQMASKAFKKAMKATWDETSDEEFEGDEVENDNLALMARSDSVSDGESSEGGDDKHKIGLTQYSTEKFESSQVSTHLKPLDFHRNSSFLYLLYLSIFSSSFIYLFHSHPSTVTSPPSISPNLSQTHPLSVSPDVLKSPPSQETPPSFVPFASLPPSIEGELGLSVAPPSNDIPGSSMKTAHTSLSPEKEPSSPMQVDLPYLIADIWSRYTSQESVPRSPSPKCSESIDDLVTLADLKKRACKRLLGSAKATAYGSKFPCVLGPASRTWACRNNLERPSTNTKSSPITRFKVKAFIEEIVDFFNHFAISRGCITSRVGKVLVMFVSHNLGSLGISCDGFAFFQKNRWSDLPPPMKPLDMVVIDVKQNHSLPYGFLLTKVLEKLGARFPSLEYHSTYNAIDFHETKGSHPDDGVGGFTDVSGTSHSHGVVEMEKLHLENDFLHMENEKLKARLVKNEETTVTHHNDLMTLIRSLSPFVMSSPSIVAQYPPSAPKP